MNMPELAGALAEATGVKAHPDAIGWFPRKLGFAYKKTLVSTERRRAKVRKQRDDCCKDRLPAVANQPERVVLIGETSVKTNLTRRPSWSQRGERLVMDAPFGPWGTQTFIAGLSAGALLASRAVKGAMDGEVIAAYIAHVLIPELEPGTVVILDNLATHKNAAVAKTLR